MGVYRRKLSRGWRWYFSGQYLGQKYHSKAIYLTKQEAKKAERIKLKELDEKARNLEPAIGLFELCNSRLDFLKVARSKDYYLENKRYFKKLLAELGDKPVKKITRLDIHNLLVKEAKRLEQSGKSNYKLNAMIRCLKALFFYGIKTYGLNIDNPAANTNFYPIKISLKYIPTKQEIEAVKSISSHNQRLLIDFVDETGCRIMEAINLTFADIDNKFITLWTKKSKNSNNVPRRLPKPQCLKGITGKGRVFKQWNAYPRFLREKIDKLSLTPKWNWHNLRHRRASIWANNGKPFLEIMYLLGHKNLQTTQNYLQLLGYGF